jgi:small subunit ribosomal protein S2
MESLPDCVIIIDPVKESNALAECKKLKIPTIALVDTNGDPTKVDYPIPANDDSVLSVQYILRALCNAVRDGLCYRMASQGL